MKKLLIIRFSAMGDVAMTVPVIHACAMENPQLQITILSRGFLKPLFTRMPANVQFRGVDLKKDYRGFAGLCRLFGELKREGYDAVADFHDVLRSKFLRTCFLLSGARVAHIQKGRKEKKQLTQSDNKVMKPLKTSFQRYADVLTHLGLCFTQKFVSIFPTGKGELSEVLAVTGEKGADKWVGIAPFAAHKGKKYPLDLMEEVIVRLMDLPHTRVFVFGSGQEGREVGERWERGFSTNGLGRVTSVIGKLKMEGELVLISHLDAMISMDSANMHLASLVATPVVSVWGATHPYAGFLGWNQKEEDVVQVDLPCRPCSVYGNKPCMRNDYACLYNITPESVVERLKKYITS